MAIVFSPCGRFVTIFICGIGFLLFLPTANAHGESVYCEGVGVVIVCSPGREIKINHATYGRTDLSVCFSIINSVVCPSADDVTASLGSLCDGKQTCFFTVSDGLFGDNCPSSTKYLSVCRSCIVSTGSSLTTELPIDPCEGHDCYYGSYCHTLGNDTAYCNCTIGVDGLHCNESAMATLASLTNSRLIGVVEAVGYAKKSQLIFQDQQRLQFTKIKTSVFEMVKVGENLLASVTNQVNREDDLVDFTTEITGMTNEVMVYVQTSTCTGSNQVTCTLDATEAQTITERIETTLMQVVNLMLTIKKNDFPLTEITKQETSVSITEIKGKDLANSYQTDVGSIQMPYWETFQTQNKEKQVRINLLSYTSNPYVFATSPETVSTPVIQASVSDSKGRELSIVDSDDPFQLSIDASTAFSSSVWREMEELQSEEGTFICIASVNQDVENLMLEVELKSTKKCIIYGRFGKKAPTKDQFDMYIETIGKSKILKSIPLGLPFTFRSQILSFALQGGENGTTEQLILTARCEDYFYRRKRSISLPSHTYKVAGVGVMHLENNVWVYGNQTEIAAGDPDVVTFKSNFFGTFSASVFFIPPETINFDEIFSNFTERFVNSPYALILIISIFALAMLISLPLRRLDNSDMLLWQYHPLQDNPVNGKYVYYMAVYTGIISSSQLSGTPYVVLTGEYSKTETRILMDQRRKNFSRGTCSHFVLTTNKMLGTLKDILVWHDNTRSNARWFLDKIIINDSFRGESFVFACNKWLSLHCEDGKMWRRLYSDSSKSGDGNSSHMTTQRMFDEHLWLSISKRPNFSRFTRVQRLWTLMALLYLSMVTSAMWYNTGQGVTGRSISLGPFTLSYKQLYVGVMSSAIAIIPSLIIVVCFKKRSFKNENQNQNNQMEKYCENKATTRKSGCRLPWWTIFFAYFLVFACIGTSGTFTFLYSLEWEGEKTLDWLFAFFFGTVQSVFVLEPVKVIAISLIISVLCKRSLKKSIPEIAPPTLCSSQENDISIADTIKACRSVKCPNTDDETNEQKKLRKRLQLDSKLRDVYKDLFLRAAYIAIICVICSHNTIFLSYLQNQEIKDSLNISAKLNTSQEVWEWLEHSFMTNAFPVEEYNEKAKISYLQRFMYNSYSYRLGPVRMRQVRIKGNCVVPDIMTGSVEICSPDYSIKSEARDNYCRGWIPYDDICFDENEDIDYSYLYNNETEIENLPFYGIFSIYSGDGYIIDLGPKQSLVNSYLEALRENDWIDNKTRAVFIDLVSFNANTRLFSHVKVVFEFPATGGVFASSDIWSSNLYPYVETWDFVVLSTQLLFIVIIFVRIVLFLIRTCKQGIKCFFLLENWIAFLDIILSCSAIVSYILRIDQTITAVEKIRNSYGTFVSFELVYVFDLIYGFTISSVLFIAILDLLRPLTFNYYLYLMKTSLSMALTHIVSYIFMLSIPLVAFSTLLYILIGHLDEEFKNMPTSLLTMLRMMLSMVSLRRTNVLETIEGQVVFGLFMIVVAIVLINMFIGILNDAFSEVKDQNVKCSDKFDHELNKHFWNKLTGMVIDVGHRFGIDLTYLVKEEDEDGSTTQEANKTQEKMIEFIDKINIFDDIFESTYEADEERKMMMSIEAFAKLHHVCQSVGKEWNRNQLYCDISKTHEDVKLTFCDFENRKVLQIIAPLKSQFVLDSLNCFDDLMQRKLQNCFEDFDDVLNERLIQIKTEIESEEEVISEIIVFPVNQSLSSVALSFDNCQTWEHHYNDSTKKEHNQELHVSTKKIPTHVHIKADIVYADEKEMEWFKIPSQGGSVCFRSKSSINQTVEETTFNVQFPPSCFLRNCRVAIRGRVDDQFSETEIYLSECTYKEVLFRLPVHRTWNEKLSDLRILQQYGQGVWKILNGAVVVQNKHILFNIQRLPFKTQFTILIKTSEVAKIKSLPDFKEIPTDTISTLETLSKNSEVARKWRQIALCLGVYSTIIQARRDSLPLCAEEFCFTVFYEWMKSTQSSCISTLLEILVSDGILQ